MNTKGIIDGATPYIPAFIGIGLIGINMLINGTFSPFALMTVIIMVIFEYIFRKYRYIYAWILPPIIAGTIVYIIKHALIDFTVMKSDALSPIIRQDARVFYRPAFFNLNSGDIIIYRHIGDQRKYVGRIIEVSDDSLNLHRPGEDTVHSIMTSQVVGKVNYILNP